MSEPGRPPAGKAASAAVAVTSLAEAWLRDTVTAAAALLSLGVVLAGFSADGAGWAVFGTVVGLAGLVMSLLPMIRRWRVSRIWAALLIVVVADVVAIVLAVTS